jgi:predicted transposase YdaD
MTFNEKYINPFTDFGFKKLFGTELNKKEQYEDSLKSYRDLKNVIDTAFEEGEEMGQTKEKTKNIVKALKRGKLTIEEIAEDFDVTIDFVIKTKNDLIIGD